MKYPSDDKLEAMARFVEVCIRNGHHPELADAAEMLRACKGRVRVKPLEWFECKDGTLHDPHCQYELETDGGMWRVTKAVTGGGSYVSDCDTLAAAKAAAQADYERRILAALDPAPDHSDWNAAIEAAAKVARNCIYHDSVGTGFDEDKFDAAIQQLKKGPPHD